MPYTCSGIGFLFCISTGPLYNVALVSASIISSDQGHQETHEASANVLCRKSASSQSIHISPHEHVSRLHTFSTLLWACVGFSLACALRGKQAYIKQRDMPVYYDAVLRYRALACTRFSQYPLTLRRTSYHVLILSFWSTPTYDVPCSPTILSH